MKFLLTLIMCSYVDQVCLPPHPWPTQFDDAYDCMMVGYDEAKAKLEEIGREVLTLIRYILDLFVIL